jgi:hypothetical protein
VETTTKSEGGDNNKNFEEKNRKIERKAMKSLEREK